MSACTATASSAFIALLMEFRLCGKGKGVVQFQPAAKPQTGINQTQENGGTLLQSFQPPPSFSPLWPTESMPFSAILRFPAVSLILSWLTFLTSQFLQSPFLRGIKDNCCLAVSKHHQFLPMAQIFYTSLWRGCEEYYNIWSWQALGYPDILHPASTLFEMKLTSL